MGSYLSRAHRHPPPLTCHYPPPTPIPSRAIIHRLPQVDLCDWEAALRAAPAPSSLRDSASILAAAPREPLPWHAAPVLTQPLAAALLHAHRTGWPLQGGVGGALWRAMEGGRLPPLPTLERLLQDCGVAAAAPLRSNGQGSSKSAQQRRAMATPLGDVVGGAQGGAQVAPGMLLWSKPGSLQGPAMVLRALLCSLHSTLCWSMRCTRHHVKARVPLWHTGRPRSTAVDYVLPVHVFMSPGASVHVLSLAAIVAAGEGDMTAGILRLMQTVRHRCAWGPSTDATHNTRKHAYELLTTMLVHADVRPATPRVWWFYQGLTHGRFDARGMGQPSDCRWRRCSRLFSSRFPVGGPQSRDCLARVVRALRWSRGKTRGAPVGGSSSNLSIHLGMIAANQQQHWGRGVPQTAAAGLSPPGPLVSVPVDKGPLVSVPVDKGPPFLPAAGQTCCAWSSTARGGGLLRRHPQGPPHAAGPLTAALSGMGHLLTDFGWCPLSGQCSFECIFECVFECVFECRAVCLSCCRV